MKLSLLADTFGVWNILLFCIHKQAASGRQDIYQYIHLLPTLPRSCSEGTISSSFLDLSRYTWARADWQEILPGQHNWTQGWTASVGTHSSLSQTEKATHCPQTFSHEYYLWGKAPQARCLLHNAKLQLEKRKSLSLQVGPGHGVKFLRGLVFAEGCTVHTSKPQASLLRWTQFKAFYFILTNL